MKNKKRAVSFLFAITLLFIVSNAFAQHIIRGTLRSSTGEVLPGITVNVKGTSKSTVTNQSGQFSIDAPLGSTLVFSSVGFQNKEVNVTNDDALDVQMQVGNQEMQQVVVIGYQTVRRRDLTGATSVINASDITKYSANTVAEAMQGLAAGVTVRNTGAPGAGAKIDIRGTGTFGGNNPLYVIDGMLSDATPDFNANDIESVQILKDASAAAIYGSRAANGVIIITTKKGKSGALKIGGNLKYGVQQFHKTWDLMNNVEYAALNKQAYTNSGLTPQGSVGAQFDPNVNTDWQDLVERTGSIQDYSLSLSGGSDVANYYISGSYFKNVGTIIGNSFERAGIRVNTSGSKGRLKFGENAFFSYAHQDPYQGNVFLDMLSMLPVMPVQASRYINPVENPEGWSYGDPAFANTFGTNTYALQKLQQEDFRFYKLRGNAFLEFRILDWLSYKFNAGLETSFDYYTGAQKPGIVRQGTPFLRPTLNENRSNFISYLLEHTLNMDKRFGDHSITAVLGVSNQTFKQDGLFAQKVDVPAYSGQYYFVPDQSGTPSVSGRIDKWANLGYFGRVNYSFADRYLLSVTVRRDGDSRFGPTNRWGTFPSVAGAWRIARENFFTSKTVSDLKLRASYGELGNSEILRPYQYAGNISALPRYVFGTNQTITYGATNIQLANSNLRWENKKTFNVGVDAAFLQNKLTATADYFIENTDNVLTNLPIALTTGNAGGNPPVNAASLKNTGFELSVGYHHTTGNLNWNLNLNATHIKNEVESLGDIGDKNYIQLGDTRTMADHPIGEWYLLHTAGIFQTQQQIDAYIGKTGQKLQPWSKPGDVIFVDVDQDGTINFDKDRTWSGTPWPKVQLGLAWDGTFKNFSLAMQWYAVFGNKLYDRPLYNLDKLGPNDNQAYRKGIQPWTAQNAGNLPRIGIIAPGSPDDGLQNNSLPQTDRWLESGSYVRLRVIELGYTFKKEQLSTIGFTSARVYLSGQNLLTFTKYKGLDPDIVGPNIFERGLDNGQFPSLRILAIGVQFGF